MEKVLVAYFREYMEEGSKPCSMDFGRFTPKYVQGGWGGVKETAMVETRRQHTSA